MLLRNVNSALNREKHAAGDLEAVAAKADALAEERRREARQRRGQGRRGEGGREEVGVGLVNRVLDTSMRLSEEWRQEVAASLGVVIGQNLESAFQRSSSF